MPRRKRSRQEELEIQIRILKLRNSFTYRYVGVAPYMHGSLCILQRMGKDAAPAYPILREIYNTQEDVNQRHDIIQTLGVLGKKTVPLLVQSLLHEEDSWLREVAADTIARQDELPPKERTQLLEYLQDEQAQLIARVKVAQALCRAKSSRQPALQFLLRVVQQNGDALQNEIYTIREAFFILGKQTRQARQLLPVLRDLLNSPQLPSIVPDLYGALRKLGEPQIEELPFLLETLEDEDWRTDARVEAAQALGEMGHLAKEAIPRLRQSLSANLPRFRIQIIESMGAIGSLEAMDALIEALHDKVEKVQHAALLAIHKLNPEDGRVFSSYLALSKHRSSHIRATLLDILSDIASSKIKTIKTASPLQNQETREYTEKVLELLEGWHHKIKGAEKARKEQVWLAWKAIKTQLHETYLHQTKTQMEKMLF